LFDDLASTAVWRSLATNMKAVPERLTNNVRAAFARLRRRRDADEDETVIERETRLHEARVREGSGD